MCSVPVGWRELSSPVPSGVELIELRVSFRLLQADTIEQRFWRVSDPKHEEYAQYVEREEVIRMVAPSTTQVQTVEAWLNAHAIGLNRSDAYAHHAVWGPLGDELVLRIPLRVAERLLVSQYRWYEHAATGRRILRCSAYSLPSSVAAQLAWVGPTLHMAPMESMRTPDGRRDTSQRIIRQYNDTAMRQALQAQRARDAQRGVADPPACQPFVDLDCLRYMYNLGSVYGENPHNSIAVTGFHDEYIASSDIHDYLAWFNPDWLSSIVRVIGPNDQSNPGGEATMDVQFIMGVASGVQATFWSTGGREPHGPQADEPFAAFMTDLLSDPSPPLVVSTSYGDDELDLDIEYCIKTNSQFQLAGLRGISVLFASGDGGVAGGHGIDDCTTFVAVYPAASPYITAVGGTQLDRKNGDETGIEFSSDTPHGAA